MSPPSPYTPVPGLLAFLLPDTVPRSNTTSTIFSTARPWVYYLPHQSLGLLYFSTARPWVHYLPHQCLGLQYFSTARPWVYYLPHQSLGLLHLLHCQTLGLLPTSPVPGPAIPSHLADPGSSTPFLVHLHSRVF